MSNRDEWIVNTDVRELRITLTKEGAQSFAISFRPYYLRDLEEQRTAALAMRDGLRAAGYDADVVEVRELVEKVVSA